MALGKLNRLELLAQLYSSVTIPQAVYQEVVVQGLNRGSSDARIVQLFWAQRRWPVVEVPEKLLSRYRPEIGLDAGETELLTLARTEDDPLVLLDDQGARSEARRLGLRVKGTLGVLVQACRASILTLDEVELLVQQIAARPDIWIGARLCEEVLRALREEVSRGPSP